MASQFVSRLTDSVRKLIVGNSASKTEAHEDPPMNIATVSVREMLFGSPTKLDFEAPSASLDVGISNVADGEVGLADSVNVETANHQSRRAATQKRKAVTKKKKGKGRSTLGDFHRKLSVDQPKVMEGMTESTELMVVIKKEPMDATELMFGDGTGHAVGGACDPIVVDTISCERQDVLLVFPFLGGDNVEKAAVGLPLCDTGDDFTCSQLITNQLDKSVGRNHLQTITQFDRDSLKEATYVNDVIIDFWLLWLSRNSSRDSLEYFFTSHCYTTLVQCPGGVELVSSWVSKRKNFSIFEKQIIYFPIILQKHWSLCVAYYPGVARTVADSGSNRAENAQMPLILHMDSLQLHNSSVIAQNVRNFFTFQWQKEFPSDTFQFTKTNYPVICPIGMYGTLIAYYKHLLHFVLIYYCFFML